MLRIPISLQENMVLPESSLKQSILSPAYKAIRSYLIILFVTNQSRINFNTGRKSSTAFLHISWVLYLSWQYFNLNKSWKMILSPEKKHIYHYCLPAFSTEEILKLIKDTLKVTLYNLCRFWKYFGARRQWKAKSRIVLYKSKHMVCSYDYKLLCVADKFSKPFKKYLGKGGKTF